MSATAHVYIGVALSGLANFLSPCLLPLVPPYLAYLCAILMRHQAGATTERSHAWRTTLFATCVFALGFMLIFAIRGSEASWLGKSMVLYSSELSMGAGLVIMLFGLKYLTGFRRQVIHRKVASLRSNVSATQWGAFLIGVAFGLSWTPCVGPILAAILTVATQQHSQLFGIILLVTYGLGLTTPFIVLSALLHPLGRVVKISREQFGLPIKLAGGFLSLCGLLIATGSFSETANWLLDRFPDLGRLEDLLTSASLRTEILNAAGRP